MPSLLKYVRLCALSYHNLPLTCLCLEQPRFVHFLLEHISLEYDVSLGICCELIHHCLSFLVLQELDWSQRFYADILGFLALVYGYLVTNDLGLSQTIRHSIVFGCISLMQHDVT
ncbi:Uncharacterized protein TCM_040251 [Theobroma cacao]|uniref:Uncharacterized protein n=1 Tax=Theobroma cacao TaxID=3641 RepID=A0A061GR95_THECC|nr:Uncharacterized protein TCM_040251 [Theobroma cacao]